MSPAEDGIFLSTRRHGSADQLFKSMVERPWCQLSRVLSHELADIIWCQTCTDPRPPSDIEMYPTACGRRNAHPVPLCMRLTGPAFLSRLCSRAEEAPSRASEMTLAQVCVCVWCVCIPPDKKMNSSEVPVFPFCFPKLRFHMDDHQQRVCRELARTRARVEPRAKARARARASSRGHLGRTCLGPCLKIPGELKTTQEMEIEVEIEAGRLTAIPGRPREWRVRCKHCENPGSMIQIQARDETAAKLQLEQEKGWRESMKCKPTRYRWWSCPDCAKHFEDKETKAVNLPPPPPPHGAPPAQSMRPPDPPDLLTLEDTSVAVVAAQVEQLQEQVDVLKAEVNRLKAEVGQVENLKAQVEQLQVLVVAQNAPGQAPVQARIMGVVHHVDVVGEC